MALFQKQPVTNSQTPLYTVGANKSVLIIGLGNPGAKYEGTRHNVGFAVVDEFAKANGFPAWTNKKDAKAAVSVHNLGETRVILVKPQTYMNLSGQAAQAIQKFYQVYNPSTMAVYDELAIPFGQLRTRSGGSDAGHNGVKSLIQHLGEDFGRLRIGINNQHADKTDAEKFVLAKFTKEEQAEVDKIIKEANVMITEFIFSGQLPHDTRKIIL
jgi:PTH1 family peptidyl-tRNA hydrolase